MTGSVRIGVGGWVFPAWRGVFYPKGLRQADELAFASRQLRTLEINSTYHSLQKPESFAAWAAAAPDDFVFTLKGSRVCTNRRVLGEGAASLERFFSQGLENLGGRLGPILWQFMPTKRFYADEFAGFLDLLPRTLDGRPLRHCVEVRNASFANAAFTDLCREHRVAICLSDGPDWPLIVADTGAGFAYARLMCGDGDCPTAYAPADLDLWAKRLAALARGGDDVFAFFIRAGKARAPAAARALQARIDALC